MSQPQQNGVGGRAGRAGAEWVLETSSHRVRVGGEMPPGGPTHAWSVPSHGAAAAGPHLVQGRAVGIWESATLSQQRATRPHPGPQTSQVALTLQQSCLTYSRATSASPRPRGSTCSEVISEMKPRLWGPGRGHRPGKESDLGLIFPGSPLMQEHGVHRVTAELVLQVGYIPAGGTSHRAP